MKRNLLSLSTCLLSISLFAQLPNGSFENWTATGLGYDEPNGWVSWNSVSFPLGGVLSCEEGSPGAVGSSFAKVTTVNVTGVGVLPGLLFTGDATAAGFPYTSRPGALNGQYQFNIPAGDGGMFGVSFTKWNTGTQTQESVGAGVLTIPPGTQTSWANFSIPIVYSLPDNPDSAIVTILSSTGGGVAGSTVWVDDLSFGPASAVNEVAGLVNFTMTPTPATTELTINAQVGLAELTVMDLGGRVVRSESLTGLTATVGVEELATGTYLARIRFADGSFGSQVFMKN